VDDLREGHRKRLLDRFDSAGLASLHDYEIVELLLTYAIPRKDVKPLAKQLVKRYKTVSALCNARPAELMEIEGIGARAALLLSLVKEVSAYCLRERYDKQCVLSHRSDVEQYLRFHYGMRHDEFFAALYLDSSNHCLATEVISEGTATQCAVHPRLVMQRGFDNGAAAFIIAHNHPGGSAEPSIADWHLTEQLYKIGKILDMQLLDHIIVLSDRTVSLKDFPRWPR
jgi:DNA repair protein RadC